MRGFFSLVYKCHVDFVFSVVSSSFLFFLGSDFPLWKADTCTSILHGDLTKQKRSEFGKLLAPAQHGCGDGCSSRWPLMRCCNTWDARPALLHSPLVLSAAGHISFCVVWCAVSPGTPVHRSSLPSVYFDTARAFLGVLCRRFSYEQCQVNVVRNNCLSVMSSILITLVFIFFGRLLF